MANPEKSKHEKDLELMEQFRKEVGTSEETRQKLANIFKKPVVIINPNSPKIKADPKTNHNN